MHYKRKVLCTGDPMLDLYLTDREELKSFNGGALNVYQNFLALTEYHYDKINPIFAYPNSGQFLKGDIYNCYTIFRDYRYPGIDFRLSSTKEKDIFYESGNVQAEIIFHEPEVLIIGDYNKGTVNNDSFDPDQKLPNVKYAIVDSRYRSLDLNWLSSSETKIWHATKDEYDSDWASNFDFVFWTNASQPVKVLRNNKLIGTVSVPETKVVNSCGCGDTFTATIAAYISLYDYSSDQDMIEYAKSAVEVCQDVLTKPFTATTTKRINEKCILQTSKRQFMS